MGRRASQCKGAANTRGTGLPQRAFRPPGWKAAQAQAWRLKRAALLQDGDAELSAMTKEEAQALLGKASKEGDVSGMERAEAAGADVRAAVYNWRDGSMGGNRTAAYVAARHNNGAGLRFLVGACGVDPNAVGNTRNGEMPIHRACSKGHTEAVTVLLALGADPTLANKNGWTPCMNAANNSGSVPCLRALVAGGPGGALVGDAYINAVSMYGGKTALDYALEKNRAEFATVLRDELKGKRGADL